MTCTTQTDYMSDIERFVATPVVDTTVLHATQQSVRTIDLGSGAFIMDMHEFAARYPERAHKTFLSDEHRDKQSSMQIDSDLFAYHRGYVLYVPAGVHLEKSVGLSCIGEYTDSFLREEVAIIIERGASVTVHDYCAGVQAQELSDVVEVDAPQIHRKQTSTEQINMTGRATSQYSMVCVVRSVSWWVYDSAHITYIHDQQYASHVTAFTTFISYGYTSSIIDMYVLLLGALFSRTVLDMQGGGSDAQVTVRGVYALAGDQHAQIISRQMHQAAASSSSVHIKGLLAGSARAIFKGTIFIDEYASNTNARLENKNLLLSDQARVSSMPILQVLNHDVQCAHGSATSQLDQELLFYAYARGIDIQTAKRLLIQGFVADLLPAQYVESMLISINNKII